MAARSSGSGDRGAARSAWSRGGALPFSFVSRSIHHERLRLARQLPGDLLTASHRIWVRGGWAAGGGRGDGGRSVEWIRGRGASGKLKSGSSPALERISRATCPSDGSPCCRGEGLSFLCKRLGLVAWGLSARVTRCSDGTCRICHSSGQNGRTTYGVVEL